MPRHLTLEEQRHRPAPWRRAADALVASAWVAICAVTPEFIWPGARVVVLDFSWGDMVSAFFIGLILAFCIEPAMERVRYMLSRQPSGLADHMRAYIPRVLVAMGGAFAHDSVCLHDAVTAFLSAHRDDPVVRPGALVTGIRVACG